MQQKHQFWSWKSFHRKKSPVKICFVSISEWRRAYQWGEWKNMMMNFQEREGMKKKSFEGSERGNFENFHCKILFVRLLTLQFFTLGYARLSLKRRMKVITLRGDDEVTVSRRWKMCFINFFIFHTTTTTDFFFYIYFMYISEAFMHWNWS